MVKIMSFVVLVAAAIWTWTLFNSNSTLSTQIHAELQAKLAVLIEETLKNKKPNSSDFELKQLFTTSINEQLISAQFSYKFKDSVESDDKDINETKKNEVVEQIISGTAILEKTPTEAGNPQKWIIQSVKTSQESVEFSEGLILTSGEEK